MAATLTAITGATGLLGGSIAARLLDRGDRVRAVVRPSTDITELQFRGFETATADIQNIDSLRRAVSGAAVVYHCAARVTDWGPWSEFEADTIRGTRHVLEACRAEGVPRVLHVSSISVYGRKPPAQIVTEETPLTSLEAMWRWDYYGRSKILAEAVAREFGPRVAIIRPSWCYGPGDRSGLPRLVDNLRRGRASIVGPGDNLLNLIHVSDVAAGAVLVADHPDAGGQSFNFSSSGEVTQVQFLNLLADALGVPQLRRHVPFGLAHRGAFLIELIARVIRKRTPPRFTRRAVYMLGRTTRFSTEKARTQLGWKPRIGIEEGIKETLEWLFRQEAIAASA